jgi:hypothetical protein
MVLSSAVTSSSERSAFGRATTHPSIRITRLRIAGVSACRPTGVQTSAAQNLHEAGITPTTWYDRPSSVRTRSRMAGSPLN